MGRFFFKTAILSFTFLICGASSRASPDNAALIKELDEVFVYQDGNYRWPQEINLYVKGDIILVTCFYQGRKPRTHTKDFPANARKEIIAYFSNNYSDTIVSEWKYGNLRRLSGKPPLKAI